MVIRIAILALASLAAVVGGGCLRTTQFTCNSDTDCVRSGAQGVCESVGYCSFTDPACDSGRRFGDLSGSFGGQCVGDQTTGDAGVDTMIVDDDDDDDDTVLDVDDNCPTTPNTNQHDEDADMVGDVCDPCPVSSTNTDGDGDGVGDACDPRPGMAGDSIVLFEGFGGGVPATWTQSNGTWTQMGDDVAANSNSTNGTGTFLTTPASMTTHETVSASIQITTLNGTQFNSVGVTNNWATASNAIACGPYRVQGAFPNPGLSVVDINNLQNAQTTGYEIMTQTYALQVRRDAQEFTCSSQRGAATPTTVSRTFQLANNPYQAGVYTTGAAVRVQWLMVVSNP